VTDVLFSSFAGDPFALELVAVFPGLDGNIVIAIGDDWFSAHGEFGVAYATELEALIMIVPDHRVSEMNLQANEWRIQLAAFEIRDAEILEFAADCHNVPMVCGLFRQPFCVERISFANRPSLIVGVGE
jgi:hypothetical protein